MFLSIDSLPISFVFVSSPSRSTEGGCPYRVRFLVPRRHGPAALRGLWWANTHHPLAEEPGRPPDGLWPWLSFGGAAIWLASGQPRPATRLGHIPLSGRQPRQHQDRDRCWAPCAPRWLIQKLCKHMLNYIIHWVPHMFNWGPHLSNKAMSVCLFD